MLGLGPEAARRLRAGEPLAVVTVVRVPGSAPRGVGASMAVTAEGELIGSISGGCVEADAAVLARLTLSDGTARRATYGISDTDAPRAGLACGGRIDVLAYRVGPTDLTAQAIVAAEARDEPIAVGLVTDGPDAGALRGPAELIAAAAAELDRARLLNETRMLAVAGASVLALTRAPKPRLIIAGAGEHAAALCRVASAAGFAVTVCDPWEILVTPERFPDAADRIVAAPQDVLRALAPADIDLRTAVCVLTHDERLDIPTLEVALRLPVGFVGAMGARRTVARRAELLRERGVDADSIARLHSPLGLDLGATAPDEVAVAVLAEIIAARHAADARPLRETTGPIHRGADVSHCAIEVAP